MLQHALWLNRAKPEAIRCCTCTADMGIKSIHLFLVIRNWKVQLHSVGIRDQPSGGLSCSDWQMIFLLEELCQCIVTNHSPEVQDLPELTSSAITSNCKAAFVCSTRLKNFSPGPCWILTGSYDEKWGHIIRDGQKQKHPSQKSGEKPLICFSLISSSLLKVWYWTDTSTILWIANSTQYETNCEL